MGEFITVLGIMNLILWANNTVKGRYGPIQGTVVAVLTAAIIVYGLVMI